MADDVILNRAGTIERCVSRVREEAGAIEQAGAEAQTHEDALVLNPRGRSCWRDSMISPSSPPP